MGEWEDVQFLLRHCLLRLETEMKREKKFKRRLRQKSRFAKLFANNILVLFLLQLFILESNWSDYT